MNRLTCRDEHGNAHPTQEVKGYYLKNLLERTAHYEDLEEQELMIKLPCKIGTPIFMVYEMWGLGHSLGWDVNEDNFHITMLSEFGKTIFLTEEEATKEAEKRNTED